MPRFEQVGVYYKKRKIHSYNIPFCSFIIIIMFIDYSKGFGGKFGVQSDRKDDVSTGIFLAYFIADIGSYSQL